jgi:hypothetical protein
VYFCRASFPALARQYYRYGVQKVQMLKHHPGAIRLRQLVPPLFVLGLMLGLLFSLLWVGFAVLWAAGIGSYVLLALIMAMRARRALMQHKHPAYYPSTPPALFLVFAAFAIIHITWGIGFWIGWLKRNPSTAAVRC